MEKNAHFDIITLTVGSKSQDSNLIHLWIKIKAIKFVPWTTNYDKGRAKRLNWVGQRFISSRYLALITGKHIFELKMHLIHNDMSVYPIYVLHLVQVQVIWQILLFESCGKVYINAH